ncbi:helix-turn-helix domain-containing protein [uncultured Limimaricola sp.]|uniref:helix-turn-helix domain-containing protein n=1 Tax=uncultured Limimaricola sp. TaxID=2211667 RepID=UPI0030FBEC67
MARGRKGKRPEEGQYAPLPYALLKSPAWRALSGPAIKAFLELHTRYNGCNNGRLFLSLNEAADILGIGKATAQRALVELQDKGFLVLTKPGNWYGRQANEWRITIKPEDRKPQSTASNDWRSRQPKTEHGSVADPSACPMGPLRNHLPRHGSAPEPVRPDSPAASGSEVGR